MILSAEEDDDESGFISELCIYVCGIRRDYKEFAIIYQKDSGCQRYKY
jgi:hypothetical protein